MRLASSGANRSFAAAVSVQPRIHRSRQTQQHRHSQFQTVTQPEGEHVTTTIDLVERSGELKAELIKFSRKPRYGQAFREALSAYEGEGGVIREGELIDALDRLVL
ncbi:MAG: hypothetical protein WAV54_17125 [Acidimicrobiales bacterium]